MNYIKLLPLLSCLLFTSCNGEENSKKIVFDKNEILKIDFYNQVEENYAVYITSPFCVNCERLESYYLNYIKNSDNEKFIACYIINIDHQELNFIEDKDYVISQKGISNIDETYFYCTPSIYLIKNQQLDKVFLEKEDLINFFTVTE